MTAHLTGGGALLVSLKKTGVDRFFINSGTEYASLLLDYMKLSQSHRPEMVVCLSESTAVAAAYGYALMNDKPSAVLVHTVPGVLSALPNLFNASSANIPVVLISGVTSFSTKNYAGSRKIRVHWGQDVRDIQDLVRQFVKWDYTVKTVQEIPEAVVRAVEMASSKPEAPVYLGFHREWLLEKIHGEIIVRKPIESSPPAADPEAVKKVGEKLVEASFPVILTRSSGRYPLSFEFLNSLAEKLCCRVNYAVYDYVNIPNTSIFSAKFDIKRADLIIVLDSDAPWLPVDEWPEDVYRVSVGLDPLKTSHNIWGYSFDQAIYSDSSIFLRSLLAYVKDFGNKLRRDVLDERRAEAAEAWRREEAERMRNIQSDLATDRLTKRLASHFLGKALPQNFVIINEYSLRSEYVVLDRPGAYIGEPPGGSLGWGFGASLGIKMARPNAFVTVVLGDGSFVFNNPVSAAALSRWNRLPVLVVVFNDGCWADVRKSISDTGVYPSDEFIAGADFPEKIEVQRIGTGLGFVSHVAEKPDEAREALQAAVSSVAKGVSALVDLRVTRDF